ncbi:hypothetical protein ABV409_14920 [Flagellimonas sp. DF-77]|uniref:hypothetical protein n=1 Tax=Flagellimonas algarum TaxID=3230298 RepID=UPI0033984013
MATKSIENRIYGKRYFALEVFEIEDALHFALLVMEYRKGELEVIATYTAQRLEDIIESIDKNKPLLVTLNTTKVLTRTLVVQAESKPEDIVLQAFPNLDLDKFYYQTTLRVTHGMVSICRKDAVDTLLEEFVKSGYSPLRLTLGANDAILLQSYADAGLTGSNFKMDFTDSAISFTSDSKAVETLTIGGLSFANTFLLAFASVLGQLKTERHRGNLIQTNEGLKSTFMAERLFNIGLRAGLGFFLLLLLCNFLVFQHYFEKNEILVAGLSEANGKNTTLSALQERVTAKEVQLGRILNTKGSQSTLYLNELGKSVPNTISLTELQFHPLESPLKPNKPILIEKNVYLVSGQTKDKLGFTIWTKQIEDLPWVAQISIVDYGSISTNTANFTLKISAHASE